MARILSSPRLHRVRCLQHLRYVGRRWWSSSRSLRDQAEKDSIGPKPTIDIKHIRAQAELYAKNCEIRNYKDLVSTPSRIVQLFKEWQQLEEDTRTLRERNNELGRSLSKASRPSGATQDEAFSEATKQQLLQEAREIKTRIAAAAAEQEQLNAHMLGLALQLPNLTSEETPVGDQPKIVGYINARPADADTTSGQVPRSHVDIGTELQVLDFAASATTSGWGWYFLKNEAALLEQALIQYALAVAMRHGWTMVTPPSIVYSHLAAACGFRPRDQHGEQQIYVLQQAAKDQRKPELCLAGTAEIPLAGMKANAIISEHELPLKVVGLSRCYRAEAGARGVDTKGLYRVHEFTKVEMFAWTSATSEGVTSEEASCSQAVFDEMVSMQSEILQSLGLSCRVLEMPSGDLGASATRKRDIEAYFPSRRALDSGGWGEVTSASMCADYQTRRLATRTRMGGARSSDRMSFPHTLNGTALAVPRVLAALLENGWDAKEGIVRIPEVLRPWMHGKDVIRGPATSA